MTSSFETIERIKNQQLCCGCGACAFVSPELFQLENVENEGIRPQRLTTQSNAETRRQEQDAVAVCPGKELKHENLDIPENIKDLIAGWGPVRGVWEGHAADEEIRFHGSSGGGISALALFGLEKKAASGVLHTVMDTENPVLNKTVLSTTRDELLGGAGSRYSPASPCERLDLIEQADGQAVFIGKPCDVAALKKVRKIRPELDKKIQVTIALFCAGTPSTAGTRAVLKKMGFESDNEIRSFRYRGKGWPGHATAVSHEGREEKMTYDQSWGDILTRHVQWRCRVCIDHTGEFADIAIGDPWYRTPKEGEQGDSLIVARTEAGEKFIREAIEAGYLRAEQIDPQLLPASQPNLLKTRGKVWGRLVACRMLFAGAPRYRGMPMFQFWMSQLSLNEKFKSIVGTLRRIVMRRYLGKR
ncbi:coenzyme F420-reducing hydrogenase subunit beta [Thalassoglobus neptunius]|uniref:Coenzyme F420-reducing hydrogenase subunit beta n=1 Tax=Thalassoglobus neptunius TaxID=1938619 RepID=A0A5C5X166_9PLAN|nr:Coenzyme F420 hydrogenase/dehydrogenase, beta subunit C-terminal domain [Thalassoglobus neptunius]TWT56737.1 coenzyme F420-reducing hydrogenase subunit beta [Thalassoglobus neptunius]